MGCCESRFKKIQKEMTTNPFPIHSYQPNGTIEKVKTTVVKTAVVKPENEVNETDKNEKPKIAISQFNYNTLTVVRVIKKSHDSRVYLMEHNIIKKIYPNNPDGIGQYQNEVAAYRYLVNCPFVTKLLYHNRNELAIYLPYLNKKPDKNNQNILTLNNLLNELEYKWKIKRLKKYHWDNLREKDGQMYLIDFGAMPFIYKTDKNKLRWLLLK